MQQWLPITKYKIAQYKTGNLICLNCSHLGRWSYFMVKQKTFSDYYKETSNKHGNNQPEVETFFLRNHGNLTLALRYGIVNNLHRGKIKLQIKKHISNDLYLVYLSDFNNTLAKAIIKVNKYGKKQVKSFYPMEKTWFKKYKELERIKSQCDQDYGYFFKEADLNELAKKHHEVKNKST